MAGRVIVNKVVTIALKTKLSVPVSLGKGAFIARVEADGIVAGEVKIIKQ